MRLKLQYIISIVVSLILLIVANYLMQPVPLSAALAVLGGMVLRFFNKSRLGLSLAMLLGMFCAMAWHYYQHNSGQSTAPVEGLLWHLFSDGLIGYVVAVAILWLAIAVQAMLEKVDNKDSNKEE